MSITQLEIEHFLIKIVTSSYEEFLRLKTGCAVNGDVGILLDDYTAQVEDIIGTWGKEDHGFSRSVLLELVVELSSIGSIETTWHQSGRLVYLSVVDSTDIVGSNEGLTGFKVIVGKNKDLVLECKSVNSCPITVGWDCCNLGVAD